MIQHIYRCPDDIHRSTTGYAGVRILEVKDSLVPSFPFRRSWVDVYLVYRCTQPKELPSISNVCGFYSSTWTPLDVPQELRRIPIASFGRNARKNPTEHRGSSSSGSCQRHVHHGNEKVPDATHVNTDKNTRQSPRPASPKWLAARNVQHRNLLHECVVTRAAKFLLPCCGLWYIKCNVKHTAQDKHRSNARARGHHPVSHKT